MLNEKPEILAALIIAAGPIAAEILSNPDPRSGGKQDPANCFNIALDSVYQGLSVYRSTHR